MKVCVVGYQGDVEEHIQTLRSLRRRDVVAVRARRLSDLDGCNGIIIPGGESTTIYRLTVESGMYRRIVEMAESGTPVMGTCAGLILISKETFDERVRGMGLLDVKTRRNAYGRQVDSFIREIEIDSIGNFMGVFIRAPIIEDAGSAKVLASEGGRPVMVLQKNVLGMTFHPELTGDTRVHEKFLNMIEGEGYISTGTHGGEGE
ncbi:pyridoxal 5'-phosphate synthase glutaminase subunit PdxT [Thermogymnomonas acidicola]|uniref:Pyridoxal 5'-phosphate synthase subunit PdxT n=1 Tax=Thermogymnomonas acidicola TaxID=399579 RepID=A0AA37BQ48_9ARCH|nr:pyridoxal 5'-phosphate synthase glutaminase subunit PdxT [Thermogymnomonas acidicola]GGM69021.1 pyridoxal 5'-phosphate synthase glutaminase subunit PdxT [Thermogymnomonas acidicola]